MDMMLIYGSIIVVWMVMAAAYVINSAAAVKVLRLFGYEKPYFGWIPLVQYYALGTVCTQKSGSLQSLVNAVFVPNAFLQWGWVLVILSGFVPAVGNLLCFALLVFYFGTVYRFLYSRLYGEDNAAFAAASSVVQIIFALRILFCPYGKRGILSGQNDLYPKWRAAGQEPGA